MAVLSLCPFLHPKWHWPCSDISGPHWVCSSQGEPRAASGRAQNSLWHWPEQKKKAGGYTHRHSHFNSSRLLNGTYYLWKCVKTELQNERWIFLLVSGVTKPSGSVAILSGRAGKRLGFCRTSWSLFYREGTSTATSWHLVKSFAFICMNMKSLQTPRPCTLY